MHKHAHAIPELRQAGNVCRACKMGKARKQPFPGHFNHAAADDEILHSDVMESLELSFPDKYKYVYIFIDDHSRYILVGFMTRRSMLVQTFKKSSEKFANIEGSIRVNTLHSDGAKEYFALQNDIGGWGKTNHSSHHIFLR